MNENNLFKVSFKNKIYTLNKEKLACILAVLEANDKKFKKNGEILKAMKKYKLIDEMFLKNLNNLF